METLNRQDQTMVHLTINNIPAVLLLVPPFWRRRTLRVSPFQPYAT